MASSIEAVRGTKDVLPQDSYKWRFVERTAQQVAADFGFREVRFPTFEKTELFVRGVGDTTDVVQKEMYTFVTKGEDSITLRPEGTASVARLCLQNGLFAGLMPLKLYYIISCFRYEKPQAGRWREFQQFGVETLGAASPAADAEIISLANEIFAFLGVEGIELHLNSIGCPECRKNYHKALKEYFESRKSELCGTCLERLEKNPMRILDCKSPICKEICKDAPVITDYICDECSAHFKSVQKYLDAMNIEYVIDPHIVRGLDYYTRTVFEFISNQIGAQGAVCAGGRYDGLVEELGGPHVPSLGFGLGTGRLLMLLEAQGIELPAPSGCELYIAPMGEDASVKAMSIVADLRAGGISAQTDVVGRSLKAQMKYADKIGAKYTMVLGDDEIAKGEAVIKDMDSGETETLSLDGLEDSFMQLMLRRESDALRETLTDGLTDELGGIDITALL